MSRELHDQKRGCLHVEERPQMSDRKTRRRVARCLREAGVKPRPRRARRRA